MSYGAQPSHQGRPGYKPSHIHGIDLIPKHWDVQRLKYFYREADERSHTGLEGLMTVSSRTGVTPRRSDATMRLAASAEGYKLCRPGDIVINTMVAFKGALGAASQVGLVSPSYGVYRPINCDAVNSDYMGALLRTESYKTLYSTLSTGIVESRFRLYADSFLGIRVPIPPPEEQDAIVRFLDHADEQIQRYIAGKERLIALLEEERQALVHQAVTRGLDPCVRLKPSGVEWLGDVPEHWDVVRLGSMGRFSKGNGGTKEDEVPAGVPCVRYGDIYTSHKYFIRASRAYIETEKTSEYTPLRYGDILFAGSGETVEEIGKSAVNLIQEPTYSGGDVIIFRPTVRLNPEFTGYATDSPAAQAQKSIMGRGFTVMHIYGNQLKNLQIALPPIHEQDGIVEHINGGTARIDQETARYYRQIGLMNEYRTRLIADVVTGQLDVREANQKQRLHEGQHGI